MTGMCDHYDAKELKQLYGGQDKKDEDRAKGTKLSQFPPRPSNAATLSVAGSATRGSNNTPTIRRTSSWRLVVINHVRLVPRRGGFGLCDAE